MRDENSVYEMKILLDEVNSGLDTEEEKISEHENRVIETIQIEAERKNIEKKLTSFIDLWENIKQSNNYIIGDTHKG